MYNFDADKQFAKIKEAAVGAVKEIFPVDGKIREIRLDRVWIEDTMDSKDYSSQSQTKRKDGTWGAPVYASLTLVEKATKNVIDKADKVKLFTLPKLTDRLSYIVGGNEYQVHSQLRLKPGVYTLRKQNGELKTQVNLARGKNFDLIFNERTGVFFIQKIGGGQANIPLYPILTYLGLSAPAISKAWTSQVESANKRVDANAVQRAAAAFGVKTGDLKDYFSKTQISPETTKLVLGKEFDRVDGPMLLAASQHLLEVHLGKKEATDRDSLVFKEIHGVEDYLQERIQKNKQSLAFKLKRSIDNVKRTKLTQLVNPGAFSSVVESFFTQDDKSATPEQTNPLEMITGAYRTTIMGSGGIQSHHAITKEMREIHPSHYGFLDPAHTPECFDGDTEVFTSDGWVKWSNISGEEKFACRIDGKLEFHGASDIHRGHYKGLMYGAKNSKVNYFVTPNHRMYVRPLDSKKDAWRFSFAEDIHNKSRTFCTSHSPYVGESKDRFVLEQVDSGNAAKTVDSVPIGDWCELWGWFLSEGSITYKEDTSAYHIKIFQSILTNSKNCQRIEALLTSLPWKWCKSSNNIKAYTIGNKQLAYHFKEQGTQEKRFIPHALFEAPPSARHRMLDAMLLGDGRTYSHRSSGVSYPQRVYCTSSQQLATDFERLAIGLGYSTTVSKYKDKRKESYHDIYEVRILQERTRSVRRVNQRTNKSDHYKKEYDGMVYCATVPGGLLLVRKGRSVPIWLGNSSKIGANLNLPMGVVKDGKELKSALVDKNGKSSFLTPAQSFEKYVAFPNQKGNMVKAMYRGKVLEIPRSKVDYFTPRPEALFSISTNLVPYLPSNQGNRVMMASKMLEQAIALKHREAPLVQVGIGPTTTERALGQQVAVLAPDNGTIKKVTADYITMKLDSGEERKLPLYNNFALNRKSFLHHEALVKEGQRVKKGELLAESNYTKNGTLALGANFRVAYLPYHGLNFEDGVVVTESAAKKLTSEHIHKKSLDINENVVLRLQAFTSFYPNALTPDNRKKLDPDGVIKKGEKIKQGEALIAVLQKRAPSKIVATISRVLSDRPKDASVYWTLEDDGVVMDVQRSGGRITIFVKTEEPAKIGDKLSGRMGNKGIITKIISDDEAPRNKKNEPVDIILNPHGIISRINIGQLYESAAGKAALKSGAAHRVDNFSGEDYLQSTRKFLKEQGISDKEELIDPTSGKSLGKVHVGNPYILKLFKQGTVNFSVRQGGPGQPYDANMQPLKAGGEEAAKSMDLLTVYSMLSHGARANLREMSSIKSNQNDEFWKALKSGQQMPPPKAPFVYDKFMGYLKGAGVNVEKEGTKLTLTPFTDAQVRGMSNGEIKKPLFYRGKDIKKDVEPMKGGFFDPIITGGIKGSKWAHVELKEPVINPVFENAARKLTGLGGKFDEIMAGRLFLGADGKLSKDGKGLTGGRAMEALLKKIDVDKEIAALAKKAEKATGSVLDDMNKRLRYLKALKDNKMSPNEAYMRKVLPVVPPSFRPLYPLPDGNITTSDVNILYQNTGVLNEMMKLDVMNLLPEEEKADLRKDLYEHVKGVSGLTDLNIKGRVRDGFISEIKGGSGGQPKEGFFISKMLSKKQDFVGRGTIIPEPDLGVDEVGLPEEMAWKLFEPFVVRELKNHGKNPLQAKEEIKAKTPLAKKALEIVMRDRHVLLNRAPSLHKFSIMAFKPQITAGRAIKIPPLVVSGFNADFDGDEQLTFILTHLTKEGISHCVDKYGLTFVEDRIMTARFKEQVPTLNGEGELLVFHLEDFPHGEIIGSKEGEKGRIDFFKALPGTRVVSYDEKTNSLQWKEVFGWSKHYQREIEIVNLSSGRQILTDDDPRAVYGVERGSLSMSRNTPTHALEKGMLVPRAHKLDSVAKEDAVGRIRKEFTPEMGYLMGCVVANGWVENSHGELTGRIFISTATPEVGNKFLDDSDKVFGIAGKRLNYEAKNRENGHGDSMKWGFYHQEAAVLLSSAVGLGARNKHLPPYFLTAPEKFRLSLFAGLMDNDGSISVSNAKNKPQLMANYSTASVRLAQDVQLLAQSLGIRCRITSSKTPAGEGFWVCSFSSIDIKKWECHGMVHPGKREKFASCPVDGDSPVAAKYDVVPVSSALAEALCKAIGAPREGAPERKSLYTVFNKAKSGGSVSRISAERVLKWVPEQVCKTLPDWDLWWGIVKNTDVTWDEVESVEKTGIREDGYDLTVPGYETFMNVDGVVLSNTMTAHIPVTPEANEEAKKMLPSANLFKPGTGTLMIAPSQEAQVGLFYLSKTPQGRGVINNLVGAKFKIDHVLDKKSTRVLLTRMAKEMPPQDYAKAVALLKKEGEKHAYETGFTLGLDDLADMRKERDKVVAYAEREAKKAKTEEQLSKVTATSQQLMDKVIENKLKDKKNPLYDMVSSGARGDKSQLRSIVASPLFVTDARGKTIARPIKKSYSEGLDVSDYWLSMYGARRGGMDRAIQTSLPGAFSKDIMASTIDNVVSSVDCGTKNGVQMKVDDVEALDRYLAGDHLGVAHNTLIDHNVITTLKKKGVQLIKVRSALTCLQAKGVCSKCHGIDEHGADPGLGDNVGAKAGQTIAEPLVQLVMNCSDGNVVGEDGKVYAMEDFYGSIDAEETYDGHCWAKEANTKILDSGEMVGAPIVQTHPVDDEMLFLKTLTGHTLLVQKNHPLWVYDENGASLEKFAEDVVKGDRLKVDKSMLIGEEDAPFNPYFLGRFLADGSGKYGNGTKAYEGVPVNIVVHSQDIEIKNKTAAACKEMEPSVYRTHVAVYNVAFAKQFVQWVRGREAKLKRLGPGFNLWKKDHLEQLLAGFLDGDSSVYVHSGTTVAQVYTSSYVLLQQLEIICSKLGVHFTPQVVSKQKLQKSPAFVAQLRFPDEGVRQHSIKMQRVPFSPAKFPKKEERYEPITYIKKLWSWDLPVWDVKTETKGFTCGMVRNHNTRHTGGVAGTGADVGGYQRIDQLLKLPKTVHGAATLATKSGQITKIEPGLAGGFNVFIGTEKVFVTQGRKLYVKVGSKVQAGDPLSDGVIKPQELVKYKGMQAAQQYIVDELHSAYKNQGVGIQKRVFETIVRSLGNTTRVVNNSKDSDYLPGDIVPYTVANHYNQNLIQKVPVEESTGMTLAEEIPGLQAGKVLADKDITVLKSRGIKEITVKKDAIKHVPLLKGISTLPLLRKDWMSSLGYRYLAKSLTEGASQRWSTDISDYHPVPALAHGATFGQGKDGKY